MHEAITNCTFFRRRLCYYRVVAGTRDLQTWRHDKRDIRGRPVSGVVVKWKPARGIHQVRTFRADVSQTLGCEWSAFRRNERATPANTQCHGQIRRDNLTKIDANARAERADTNRILNPARQGLPVHFDAFDLQRTIELEDDWTRRIQRHKAHVGARSEQVLIRNDLRFNPVVGDVETAGGLLRRGLLRPDWEGQRQQGQNSHNAGDYESSSFHGFMTTIIQSRTLDGKKPQAVGRKSSAVYTDWKACNRDLV